jgi:EmrB/QacA subfamily drug resistance transporter
VTQPAQPLPSTDAVVDRRAWQTLYITSVAVFLVAMDVTIVSVALPGITRSFDEPASTLSWVFTAYNITFAALLLLAGKVGDRWGRKPSFLTGLVLFAVASLLAALAPSAAVLIAARVLQALGSALIYPASLALLLPEFPLSRRSMALGIWGGIAGLGGAVAPTLGALLVEWFGWRSVFFINVPFVAAAIAAGVVVLRDSKGDRAGERFDPVAVPMASLAIGVLVLGVVQGESWGWGSGRVIGCFVAAGVLLPAFLLRSSRHPAPLLDLDLFRIRTFAVGVLAQALYVGSCFGWLVLMPSFFVNVWGWSPLAAGFGLAPSAALSAVLSPLAGRLADRFGHRWLVSVGAVLGAAGTLWWIAMVGERPNYALDVLPGMLLLGLGITSGFATITGALMSRVPPRFYSMAGATRSTIFQLATAVGIAVAVAVIGAAGAGDPVAPYRRVWWIASICALMAAGITAALFPARAAAQVASPAS